MKLSFVTITGIDEKTELSRVKDLSEQYPFAEFGVLMSYDWSYNGPRFPSPSICDMLANLEIKNLSAHLCGQLAIDVAYGHIDKVDAPSFNCFDIFKRCQLNLRANGMFDTLRLVKPFKNLDEVIVQMHTPEMFERFLKGELPAGVSYLLDASGGRGIDTPIEVVTSPGVHVGYAGGISPDNVEKKLRTLLEYDSDERFWIDMETRVRTEDEWLDLDKVERVLEICDPIIKEYKN